MDMDRRGGILTTWLEEVVCICTDWTWVGVSCSITCLIPAGTLLSIKITSVYKDPSQCMEVWVKENGEGGEINDWTWAGEMVH